MDIDIPVVTKDSQQLGYKGSINLARQVIATINVWKISYRMADIAFWACENYMPTNSYTAFYDSGNRLTVHFKDQDGRPHATMDSPRFYPESRETIEALRKNIFNMTFFPIRATELPINELEEGRLRRLELP